MVWRWRVEYPNLQVEFEKMDTFLSSFKAKNKTRVKKMLAPFDCLVGGMELAHDLR